MSWRGVAAASLLTKGMCVEGDGKYFVRDDVCLFLGKMFEGVQRAEAAVPDERLLTKVLDKLFNGRWLSSSVNGVTKEMCRDRVPGVDGTCEWCL